MKEISIEADQVKRSTISDLRTAAQNEGIFGDEENSVQLFPSLQNKYNCIIEEKNITLKLSLGTAKEVLMDIKNILEKCTPGEYHVWLDI